MSPTETATRTEASPAQALPVAAAAGIDGEPPAARASLRGALLRQRQRHVLARHQRREHIVPALAAHGFAIIPDPWPLYVLGLVIALVDGVYIAVYRRLRQWPLARVRRHVYPVAAGHRSKLTGCPLHEPSTLPDL
mgnify:CR=1 FL=1